MLIQTPASTKIPLVVWGASGHALVVADIVRLMVEYEIIGYLDDVNPQRHGTAFGGSAILGGQDQLERLRETGIEHLIVAFGHCNHRLQAAAYAKKCGFRLLTAIHPRATIAMDTTIGEGSVVMAGAVVNSLCSIGSNVIVNTSASIDHECALANGVHVSPGVHLAGSVAVGKGTTIGIGATVIDHIHIGSDTVIGAGAVVITNIPDNVVAAGVPARILWENHDL